MTQGIRDDSGGNWFSARLVRWGTWRLTGLAARSLEAQALGRHQPIAGDALALSRRAGWQAFGVGFILTAILAGFEIALFPDFSALRWDNWPNLLLFGLANLLLVGIEFYLLFLIGFRTTARLMAHTAGAIAGTQLAEAEEEGAGRSASLAPIPAEPPLREPPFLETLARAVLDESEPGHKPFGVDPQRDTNRLSLLLSFLLWRTKTMLSNIVARLILRRLLTRYGLRSWSAFIAAPITALWDQWAMVVVLREVRFRLAGRVIVGAVLEGLQGSVAIPGCRALSLPVPGSPQCPAISPPAREALFRLASKRLSLFDHYSYTIDLLLTGLHRLWPQDLDGLEAPDDWERFLAVYHRLEASEAAALRALALLLFALKRQDLSRAERARLAEMGVDAEAVRPWHGKCNRLAVTCLRQGVFEALEQIPRTST